MSGKSVKSLVPAFLNNFVPDCSENAQKPDVADAFKQVPIQSGKNKVTEKDMYKPLVDAINSSGLCPGFVAQQCESKKDPSDPSKQSVDICLFRISDHKGQKQSWHWSQQVLNIEVKRSAGQDPFDDDKPNFDDLRSEQRQNIKGQISSYAEKLFLHQQNCFCFTVIIMGPKARICRWDRSGVVATVAFDWTKTTFLGDFLWLFCHLSPEQQGRDPSATRLDIANSPEAQMMRQYAKPVDGEVCSHARQFFHESLDEDWPWWKLRIDVNIEKTDEAGRKTKAVECRGEYLVGKPRFKARGVTGRGTRGYVALNYATKEFVWLKDAWRVEHDEIIQEGLILEELRANEVANIPTLLSHGDILDQRTVTQDYWKAPTTDPNMSSPLKAHRHYRMVVKEVCLPLDQFENGQELVTIILCCLDAHEQAYTRTNRLHRDISATNIMIFVYEMVIDEKKVVMRMGMLCDWELSKKVATGKEKARQPDRTGTWQYMSVNAVNDPYHVIAVPDELESFVHVIVEHGVRYIPHNFSPTDIGSFIYDYFDAARRDSHRWICGYRKEAAMTSGVIAAGGKILKFQTSKDMQGGTQLDAPSMQTLEKDKPEHSSDRPSEQASEGSDPKSPPPSKPGIDAHPLNTLLEKFLAWFRDYYALQAYEKRSSEVSTSGSEITNKKIEHSPALALVLKARRNFAGVDPQPEAKGHEDAEWLKRTKARASKLNTHANMQWWLVNQLETAVWPVDDKTADQLPVNYNNAREARVATESSKRSLSALEGGASDSGSNKRPKTAGPSSLRESAQ